MPTPESWTTISACEFTRSRATRTRPPGGVNFTAFASRFHSTCWRRAGSTLVQPMLAVERFLDPARASASAAGRTASTALLTAVAQIDGLHVEAHLAGHDAAHVEQVVHDLSLCANVALDRVERAGELRVVAGVAARDVHPADDRIQRRAQLVGERCEELVLQAARLFGFVPHGAFTLQQCVALLLRQFPSCAITEHDAEAGDVSGGIGGPAQQAGWRRTACRLSEASRDRWPSCPLRRQLEAPGGKRPLATSSAENSLSVGGRRTRRAE